jgi:hypothetical protein
VFLLFLGACASEDMRVLSTARIKYTPNVICMLFLRTVIIEVARVLN